MENFMFVMHGKSAVDGSKVYVRVTNMCHAYVRKYVHITHAFVFVCTYVPAGMSMLSVSKSVGKIEMNRRS